MPEKIFSVRWPLISALDAIGGSSTILESTDLALSVTKFPDGWESLWVTGLKGKVGKHVRCRVDDIKRTLKKGDPWEIRWDYDEAKGTHVNFGFGSKPGSKIAFLAPKPDVEGASALYHDVLKNQTEFVDYRSGEGDGTPGERVVGVKTYTNGEEKILIEQENLDWAARTLAEKWDAQYQNYQEYGSNPLGIPKAVG